MGRPNELGTLCFNLFFASHRGQRTVVPGLDWLYHFCSNLFVLGLFGPWAKCGIA